MRENRWKRGRIGIAPSRVQFTNCLSHNPALRPGACPYPKHPVLFSTIVNAGYKAAFCLLVISREEKRQLIKAIHILVKNLEKLLASRVLLFTVSRLSVGLLSHFLTSRERHEPPPARLHLQKVWSRTPLPPHTWHESA